MNKIMTTLLIMLPMISVAEPNVDLRSQMLDSEIEKYTQIRDEKYEALKQCEKTTKGFKIAGITTLIATGVGVGVDIKLAKDLKKISKEQDMICDLSRLNTKETSLSRKCKISTQSVYSDEWCTDNNEDLKEGEWEATFSYGVIKGESKSFGICDSGDDDGIVKYCCSCRITSFKPAGIDKECIFSNSEWVEVSLIISDEKACASACENEMGVSCDGEDNCGDGRAAIFYKTK